MENKTIYKRMLCKATAKNSKEIVYGFLELDEDKNNWCMCTILNKDGDYTSNIEEMYSVAEYIMIDQDTIEFVNGYIDIVVNTLNQLTYSELEAVEHMFKELEGNEGLLIASKVADRVGITRSVIVNSLRRLESTGLIETRSLGMKGTHIKILNDNLLSELERYKTNNK